MAITRYVVVSLLALASILHTRVAAASNTALAVSPVSLNFQKQKINLTSSSQTVTVTNISGSSVTINGFFVSSQRFAVSGPSNVTLMPGVTQSYTVTFTPTTAVTSSGQLTFHTTGTYNVSVPVSLTGTGVSTDAAAVTLTPASIAFGNQSVSINTCGSIVTISNGGSTAVTINSETTSGPFTASSFSPTTIPAGSNSSATVSYSPQPPGQSDTGTLTVTFNNGVPNASVSLTGTGVQTSWNQDPLGKIPLIDMGTNRFYTPPAGGSFEGGLYDGGCNNPPADHDTAGRSRAALIQPLDTNGNPSSAGQIVFLSIGMSNAIKEWCGLGGGIGTCETGINNSLMAQAAASKSVNHTTLMVLDGAASSQQATDWDSYTDPDYDSVKNSVLVPRGLSENQVQAIWLKEVDITHTQPPVTPSLPDPNADAYTLETNLANIVRAAKHRYPNLQIVFLSSRIFGGFATPDTTREPFAYETGFAVKWLVKAQIDQIRNGGAVVDSHAGDLDYNVAVGGGQPLAPWIVWERLPGTASLTGSTYIWAYSDPSTGTAYANSDGVIWPDVPGGLDYFETDGQHPNMNSGIPQVGTLLFNYFLSSCYSKPWFLASPASCP